MKDSCTYILSFLEGEGWWHFRNEGCWKSRFGIDGLLGHVCWPSQVMLLVNNLPTNIGGIRDLGLIPESGRSVEVGNGTPHQYSCLENSIPWAEEPGRLHSPWGCKELQTMKRLSRVSMTWDFIISLEKRSLFSSSLSLLPYWCSPNEVVSRYHFIWGHVVWIQRQD